MNYLKDLSTLEAIQKRYSALPAINPWGVEDLAEEPSFDSSGRMVDPGQKGIERPQNEVWHDSARFGKGAYNRPYQEYIKLDTYGKGRMPAAPGIALNPNFQVQKQGDEYHGFYKRTGRDLGQLPNYQRTLSVPGGGTYTSKPATNPVNIDYMLDIADELNRIDPNVYQFNLRNMIKPPEISSVRTGNDSNPLIRLPKMGGM